jgi:hypothetical protein
MTHIYDTRGSFNGSSKEHVDRAASYFEIGAQIVTMEDSG